MFFQKYVHHSLFNVFEFTEINNNNNVCTSAAFVQTQLEMRTFTNLYLT